MKIYTKTGDKGTTSLVGGERVDKFDLRVEAYGSIDELTANIAYLKDSMALANVSLDDHITDLYTILNSLMTVAALLATTKESAYKVPDITNECIANIEEVIDQMSAKLDPISKFTIPGGHPLVSLCHICRTVCRRAERSAIKAAFEHEVSEHALIYLNRLSDYLYLLGRSLTIKFNTKETYWIV